MGKINQMKAGVVLTYVNMGVGTLIPMFYTPVMLRILGQNEYGLYSLSNSVISYLSLLSFGLGGTIVRYIAKYRAEGKKNELEHIAGMSIMLYSFLAFLVIFVGIILSFNSTYIFQQGLTAGEQEKIRILIIIMSFNTAISFPISVFSSIVMAYERYIYRQCVNIFSTILAPCANLVALYLGYTSIGLAVSSTVLQVLMLPLYAGYCYKVLDVHPRFKNPPFHLLREILGFSLFVFLGSLVDLLFWSTDKVILGMLAGTSAVAVYNIGSQFNSMMTNLSTAFTSVLTPKTTIMAARNASDKEMTDLFIKVGRLQYILISLVLSGFIVFGRQFIILWAGNEYEDAYVIALVTLIPLSIPLIQNTGYSILLAENKHRFRSVVYLIIAIINIISTYCVVPRWGGIGAAVCSGLSYVLGQGIIMNIYYYKVIGLDIPKFWKNIFRLSVVPIIMLLIGIYGVSKVTLNGWGSLFAGIIVYSVIFVFAVYFTGMNTYEKDIVKKPLTVIKNKFKNKKLN